MTPLGQGPFGHEWGCAKVHLAKQYETQSRREGKSKHYIPLILTILPKDWTFRYSVRGTVKWEKTAMKKMVIRRLSGMEVNKLKIIIKCS